MRRPVWLWIGFAAVHVWLGFLALHGPGNPIGDVAINYPAWIDQGLRTGRWVGIQTPWVYPVLALVPMLVPHLLPPALYVIGFLTLASLADAAALAVLLGGAPDARRVGIGWGWALFLLLLGPVAIARIDAFATALALAALVLLARRPRVAAALLTLGAWIKVWPAVLVALALVIDRRRRSILVVAAAISAALVVLVLALGGNPLSFLGQQSGRGLQLESTFATPFVLAARGGTWSVYYDLVLLTYQLRGPGVDAVAAVTTPLLVALVAGLLLIAGVAVRRGAQSGAEAGAEAGADAERILPWAALALVATLIAINKVGSPQFVGWLAVPVIAGLLFRGFGFRTGFGVPALGILAIALLTHIIYPDLYDSLVALDPALVAVLVLRNTLELALCVGAIAMLIRVAARSGDPVPARARLSEEV